MLRCSPLTFNLDQLFYGEEQSFYLFDNGASNYLYGYATRRIIQLTQP